MKFSTRLAGGLLAAASTANAAITLDLTSTGEYTPQPYPEFAAWY
jgi:hypothetical protein